MGEANGIRPGVAERIYAILIEHAGARAEGDGRWSFCHYVAQPTAFGHEWRFMGNLGFGGKFYNDGRTWRVGCYGEDKTLERDEIIKKTNVALAELFEASHG